MNKKIAIAVGAVASVAFAGSAFAANTQTINSSEGYVTAFPAGKAFVGAFVNQDCDNGAGVTVATGNCNGHGEVIVSSAAGLTGAAQADGATAIQYFNNSDFMPVLNGAVFTAGMEASGYRNATPFGNGIFDVLDVTNSVRNNNATGNTTALNYFAGLMNAWSNNAAAISMADRPLGAPDDSFTSDVTEREIWVDQIVVGYIVSTTDASQGGGTDINYVQNFRAQVGFTGNKLSTALAQIDQRLEQQVELATQTDLTSGTPFEASQQTIQMAFQSQGTIVNFGTNPDVGAGGAAQGVGNNAGGRSVGQLVSQDIEGYFLSCSQCDSNSTGTAHHFATFDDALRFQAYENGYLATPTIKHKGLLGGTSTVNNNGDIVF